MPHAQFLTKQVNCKVWHQTRFMAVLILLLPDNVPKMDARLHVMQQQQQKNPSSRKELYERQKT